MKSVYSFFPISYLLFLDDLHPKIKVLQNSSTAKSLMKYQSFNTNSLYIVQYIINFDLNVILIDACFIISTDTNILPAVSFCQQISNISKWQNRFNLPKAAILAYQEQRLEKQNAIITKTFSLKLIPHRTTDFSEILIVNINFINLNGQLE